MQLTFRGGSFPLRAKTANLSISEFIRRVACSEEKLIVLDDGGTIACTLIAVNDQLEQAFKNRRIPVTMGEELFAKLDAICEKFDSLMEQLTDIHAESEKEANGLCQSDAM